MVLFLLLFIFLITSLNKKKTWIKTFSVPPQWFSPGILTGLHSTWQMWSQFSVSLIPFQLRVFLFQVSFPVPLLFTVRGKKIPRESFFPFFLRLQEAVGEEDRVRHPSLFSFLAQVEPSYVLCLLLHFPKFKTVIPQQDSWLIFKMH